MNKKMSKRQKDIKSKLMAAICMLLVSSIMMVSTTYAWFTLSTAPEVTGITTAVGANGNLEMALLPSTPGLNLDNLGDPNVITSAVGDSKDAAGQTIAEANVTWGNLVDLQDTAIYGLDKVMLNPAKLHLEDDGTVGSNPLERPVYGVDGRVSELKNDVLTGVYAGNAFYEAQNIYGVRAAGTASSMSPRELEHRSTVQEATKKVNAAKTGAAATLNSNGGALAKLAIKKIESDAPEITRTDVQTLQTVVNALDASLDNLESALKYYAAANAIAPAAADANYATMKTNVLAMDLDALKTSGYATTGFAGAIDVLKAEQTKVSTAQSNLTNLLADSSKTTYTWSDINTTLNLILNMDMLTVDGKTMTEAKAKDDDGNYIHLTDIGAAALNGTLVLGVHNGSGTFATIAELCGDYTSIVTFPEGTVVKGISLVGKTSTMKTMCIGTGAGVIEGAPAQISPAYMTAINNGKTAFVSADGSGTSATAITEYYGYIIDLAFRTNVSGSDLLLQTDAQNRIYSNNTENEAIMGAGSTMAFTGSDTFVATNVQKLMKHIRVVFFEPNTGTILANARLDAENPVSVEGYTVTANLYLYDEESDTLNKTQSTAAITGLEQNTAKAVSALVYLDGESITNADVANGTSSMTGTMNLQFSSSATLVPMEYSDLKQGGNGTTSATSYETLASDIITKDATATDVSILAGYVVKSGDTVTGVGVRLNNVPSGKDVWLSVNGGTAVKADKASYSGFSGYGVTFGQEVTSVEVSLRDAESTPTESTPTESTPTESTPTESTPTESTPTESTPTESTPTD